jgi:hypothetical protein
MSGHALQACTCKSYIPSHQQIVLLRDAKHGHNPNQRLDFSKSNWPWCTSKIYTNFGDPCASLKRASNLQKMGTTWKSISIFSPLICSILTSI